MAGVPARITLKKEYELRGRVNEISIAPGDTIRVQVFYKKDEENTSDLETYQGHFGGLILSFGKDGTLTLGDHEILKVVKKKHKRFVDEDEEFVWLAPASQKKLCPTCGFGNEFYHVHLITGVKHVWWRIGSQYLRRVQKIWKAKEVNNK